MIFCLLEELFSIFTTKPLRQELTSLECSKSLCYLGNTVVFGIIENIICLLRALERIESERQSVPHWEHKAWHREIAHR